MAEKELAILLRARGATQAARDIGKVDSAVGKLGRTASQGARTAISNIGRLTVVAGGAVALAVKGGLSSLAELEGATTSVTAAIDQMGLVGQLTAAQVAGWANEIESDIGAAFDDKEITRAATTLLRFGKVTPGNLRPALVVMTDLATKTGSVDSAAQLLAKALADPAKAAGKLARSGVVLTKEQQAQITAMVKAGRVADAQAFILDQLAESTSGAAAASQGPYRRAMAVLADVTEDAQRALATGLLPVLEKAADLLGKELAKPSTIKGLTEFGSGIAGGLDAAINIARNLPWASIGEAFRIGGIGAKAVLDTFIAMPPWVQTAVLTGWGLNKLTGGAVGSIVSQLASGMVKGVLGMSAGVVNIRAGAVTGAGGAAGAAGAAGRAGGGFLGKVAILGSVALAGATIVALKDVLDQQSADNAAASAALGQQTTSFVGAPTTSREDLAKSLAGLKAYREELLNGSKAFTAEGIAFALNIDHVADTVKAQIAAIEAALRASTPSSGDPRVRPKTPTGATVATGPRWGARTGPLSADPKVAAEQAAVARFAASTAPSMRSMEAHLASLRTLQTSASSKDATNTAAIVAAIARLESRIASLPTPIVNVGVTAKAVAGATTSWRRTGRGARLAAW